MLRAGSEERLGDKPFKISENTNGESYTLGLYGPRALSAYTHYSHERTVLPHTSPIFTWVHEIAPSLTSLGFDLPGLCSTSVSAGDWHWSAVKHDVHEAQQTHTQVCTASL